MACVDIDLCDKIDALNTLITDSNATQNQLSQDVQTVSQTLVSAETDLQYLQQGEALILGFLAWFLFIIIIKFFLNFFKQLF